MTTSLPLFPLNSVVFPGVTTPLHVFEERYRSLVRDLLAEPDPTKRVFGITAIREGFEVGPPGGEHGKQSLHTTGTVVQLVGVEPYDDGRFDIETVGRQRFQLWQVDGSGEYAVGTVDLLDEPDSDTDDTARDEAARTLATFRTYRDRLSALRGDLVLGGDLPADPTYLSWSLSATCLLTQSERQALLEAPDAATRLTLLRHSLVEEMKAMQALPSLPATGVSRLGWSPN